MSEITKFTMHTSANFHGRGIEELFETQAQNTGCVFLKTVNGYGVVELALDIADSNSATPWIVHRLSTDGDNIEEDVPRYDLSPAEAADIHWQNTKEKTERYAQPHGGFDKRVWIEPINEVGRIHSEWLGEFALLYAKKAWNEGYKTCWFGWSSGTPEPEHWRGEKMTAFLEYCVTNPDHCAIALHEYSYNNSNIFDGGVSGQGYKIGRFAFVFDYCMEKFGEYPLTFITEWGWNATDIPDYGKCIQDIRAVSELYNQYDKIVFASIWWLGKAGYGAVGKKVEGLTPLLTASYSNTPHVTGETVGNEAVDAWNYITGNVGQTHVLQYNLDGGQGTETLYWSESNYKDQTIKRLVKGNAQWRPNPAESFYSDDNFVYRMDDTSEGVDVQGHYLGYRTITNGLTGSVYLPRFVNVGDSWEQEIEIEHYTIINGECVPRNKGSFLVRRTITSIGAHRLENGTLIQNAIVLLDERVGADYQEIRAYGLGMGLIAFAVTSPNRNGESWFNGELRTSDPTPPHFPPCANYGELYIKLPTEPIEPTLPDPAPPATVETDWAATLLGLSQNASYEDDEVWASTKFLRSIGYESDGWESGTNIDGIYHVVRRGFRSPLNPMINLPQKIDIVAPVPAEGKAWEFSVMEFDGAFPKLFIPPLNHYVSNLPTSRTAQQPYSIRDVTQIDTFVMHHVGSGNGETTPETINRFHIDVRKWYRIAYTDYIQGSGEYFRVNNLDTQGFATGGHNEKCLAVCWAGDLSNLLPTENQILSAVWGWHQYDLMLGKRLELKGHREVTDGTVCPSNLWPEIKEEMLRLKSFYG